MKSTTIHILALDSNLNVNSLFAFAAFLGLTLNPPDPTTTLVGTISCAAASATAEHLVEFHVFSFSAFIFSSLIISALKLAIRGDTSSTDRGKMQGRINLRLLQAGITAAAAGSLVGCGCMTVALVDFVQIKLGLLKCWAWPTLAAVSTLLVLVPSALVIYVCFFLYAFSM